MVTAMLNEYTKGPRYIEAERINGMVKQKKSRL